MDTQLVLQFLADLAKDNNRHWFLSQSERFQAVKNAFTAMVSELLDDLAHVEPRAANLDPAKQVFRIYRDVRFAKDKSPYKTHMAAMLSPGKGDDPGCYFHIQPGGQTVVAGGLYQPTPAELAHVRSVIARDSGELRAILKERAFRKYFPNGFNHGEPAKVVRGFKPDHPEWELLRVKSYACFANFTDEQVADAMPFFKSVKAAVRALIPLNHWLERNRGNAPKKKEVWA